jgi:hypothetical protein
MPFRRFWKGGTMSTMSLHCQNRVQRLRGGGATLPCASGSRGRAPGVLRHLLPLCCSNPRRTSSETVRLCECGPWAGAHVKSVGHTLRSEIPAKIAAFFLKKTTARPFPLPKGSRGVSGVRASGRIHSLSPHHACRPGARMGTFPPFSLLHGPPPKPPASHGGT